MLIPEAISTPKRRSNTKAQKEADDSGLYLISVAAGLLGVHPQTLREYDRLGFVTPRRVQKKHGRRMYSTLDLRALSLVIELSSTGVNHAGIKEILRLSSVINQMQEEITFIKARILQTKRKPGSEVVVYKFYN